MSWSGIIVRNMPPVAAVPLLVLAVGVAVDLWVYSDAKRQAEVGRAVIFQAGAFVLDSPAAWAMGCLILWVVFFPLYLASRA